MCVQYVGYFINKTGSNIEFVYNIYVGYFLKEFDI